MIATGSAALPLLLAGDGFATSVAGGVTVTPATLPAGSSLPVGVGPSDSAGSSLPVGVGVASGVGVTSGLASPRASE